MMEGETLLTHRALVMSSTRRTDIPARYISMRAASTLLSTVILLNDGGLKENPFEFRHLENDIPRSSGEVAVVVVAAVSLALLIALVSGSLSEFLCLSLQQFVESSLYTAPHKYLGSLLITASFSCTIFSDMVCYLLSNVCVATSFYQRSVKHVFSFLRNIFYFISPFAEQKQTV